MIRGVMPNTSRDGGFVQQSGGYSCSLLNWGLLALMTEAVLLMNTRLSVSLLTKQSSAISAKAISWHERCSQHFHLTCAVFSMPH